MKKIIIYTLFSVIMATPAMTQIASEQKNSRAWEIGLGGSAFQFSRTSFSDFANIDKGYKFDLTLQHVVWGGNIYVARELNKHFYLDIQGTVGATTENIVGKDKTRWMYMAGGGLQWRLGEYFGSKYIDPYLRAGLSYMHKGFDINYTGTEGLSPEEMKWVLENIKNKEGDDRCDLMPISLGGGLNMWLNDRWGIGMQADYLVMPYDNVANSLQGTVRIMYRIGGKSKKAQPEIQYVEKVIERVVEKPITIATPTPTIVQEVEKFMSLDGINFDFDKATLLPQSEEILEKLAKSILQDTTKHYLITGYTDSKGSSAYNQQLSQNRADAVVQKLIEKGVPSNMLKSRGVGSKVAFAKASDSDVLRNGDRKMTIELISNIDYWDYLPVIDF